MERRAAKSSGKTTKIRSQALAKKADALLATKKKQKVDPKIINKALDMFDKMKPNDKQKMQESIGKAYRDLLKTVQRGRV